MQLVRVWCYLLGPFSAAFILKMRRYAGIPAVRYHAFHSLLVAAVWALVSVTLWAAESVSPWFLGTLLRETRLMFNLVFAGIWAGLVVAAYRGWNFTVLQSLENWARRWAARTQPVT